MAANLVEKSFLPRPFFEFHLVLELIQTPHVRRLHRNKFMLFRVAREHGVEGVFIFEVLRNGDTQPFLLGVTPPERRKNVNDVGHGHNCNEQDGQKNEPIPEEVKPTAIARKTLPISLALPEIDRNLTRLNTPITAIPAPMFPFTSIMTI